MIDFHVTSGVGARTGQPIVTVAIRTSDFTVTISPEDARALAINLLECAASSETDAWLVAYLRGQGLNDKGVAAALVALRQYKMAREGGDQ